MMEKVPGLLKVLSTSFWSFCLSLTNSGLLVITILVLLMDKFSLELLERFSLNKNDNPCSH